MIIKLTAKLNGKLIMDTFTSQQSTYIFDDFSVFSLSSLLRCGVIITIKIQIESTSFLNEQCHWVWKFFGFESSRRFVLTRKQIKKWKRRIFRVDLRFFLCYAISQSCASPHKCTHKCNFLLLVSADACYVTESTPSAAALAWTHNTIESGGEKMEENRGRILNFLCIFSGVESERKNKNSSTHNGMELRRKKMKKVRIVHPPTPT